MNNLHSARQALQAELQHAKEGAAFYQTRIQAIEDALEKIANVDMTEAGSPSAPKRAARTGMKQQGKRAQSKKAGGKQGGLPATGKQFWLSLITPQPISAKAILEAAIAALGGNLSPEDRKKLFLRQTNALHNLVKAKEVEDSGSGRERLFFRSE